MSYDILVCDPASAIGHHLHGTNTKAERRIGTAKSLLSTEIHTARSYTACIYCKSLLEL
jgi:hypothetical protein